MKCTGCNEELSNIDELLQHKCDLPKLTGCFLSDIATMKKRWDAEIIKLINKKMYEALEAIASNEKTPLPVCTIDVPWQALNMASILLEQTAALTKREDVSELSIKLKAFESKLLLSNKEAS